MKLERVTAPAATPVSVDDMLEHLWTVYDNTADSYLQRLLTAATSHTETVTGRVLVSQQWRGYLQEWPAGDSSIPLPFGRTVSVDALNWLDAGGTDHTISDFIPAVVGPEPQIMPADTWPSDELFSVDPIRVLFTAGFGDPEDVPEDLRQAIAMLAAHWYEIREAVITGTQINKVPMAYDALVNPWRMRRYV